MPIYTLEMLLHDGCYLNLQDSIPCVALDVVFCTTAEMETYTSGGITTD